MITGKILIPKEHSGKDPKPAEYQQDDKGCWNCISHTRDKGYPIIRRGGKLKQLSRVIYVLTFGPIPEGEVVRHQCDNPACINPQHLITGTIADNMMDRHERGRDARNAGSSNGNSTLTEEQAKEILANPQFSLNHFAKKFGVWKTTIADVRNKKTWKCIDSV